MALRQSFYDAVSSKDLLLVRIMMKNSLLFDPSFNEFNEMDRIASKLDGVYVEFDGEELIWDKQFWNEEYKNVLLARLIDNFSYERVEHLKKVVRYLSPVSEEDKELGHKRKDVTSLKRTKSDYQKQKEQDIREGNYLGAKYATGAIAGAVVGGTVAAAASVLVASEVVVTTIAGGAAVGAAAGIGIVALGEKGDKENE